MRKKSESQIEKAKADDKKKYGIEGITLVTGYITVDVMLDIVKLTEKQFTPTQIGELLHISSNEALSVLIYFFKFVGTTGNLWTTSDKDDIKCLGGSEYSERSKLQKGRKLTDDDLGDILIDIHQFGKGETTK